MSTRSTRATLSPLITRGFNTASGVGYILGGSTATFGTPLTLATGGVNGQSLTLTSAETVNGTTTTDTFTLTTPTNFITTTTVNGTKITSLQFDIGDANSGVIPGAPDTVDYALPVTGNTQTGNILYGTTNTSFTLTPTTTLTNGGQSLAAVEGVNDGTTAISTLAVHSFTYSVTYNTIPIPAPEPSTYAFVGAGALLLGMATVRRNRRQDSLSRGGQLFIGGEPGRVRLFLFGGGGAGIAGV